MDVCVCVERGLSGIRSCGGGWGVMERTCLSGPHPCRFPAEWGSGMGQSFMRVSQVHAICLQHDSHFIFFFFSDSDSLFTEFFEENVSKSGKHTNISKRQH